MTRDDLRTFRELDIDFEALGLLQEGGADFTYFCTPTGAELVGRIGCDGVHFVLLPGNEGVYCVDPAFGEVGTYVLPVGRDLREFLSFVLFCRDANPISQIWWMDEARFRSLLQRTPNRAGPAVRCFPPEKGRRWRPSRRPSGWLRRTPSSR